MPFKKLLAAFKPQDAAPVEYPLETEDALNRLHGAAPVDAHLRILFREVKVGTENFVDLYQRCLAQTGTPVTPFNVFHRFQSRRDLLQYFFATLALPGARAECGTYRSASGEHDLIAVRGGDGKKARREAFFPVAKADISPELVRGFFGEFSDVAICAGWIPQVFATLPERDWAFVHLDVTLYEPTLAALEYFYPRLNAGGVIVCDGSIFCPGAKKAWDEFCAKRELPFVVLGNRESILIKQAPRGA